MSCSRLLIASLALLALSCGGVATIPNPMWASPAGGSTAQEQPPATSPLPAPVEKRVLAVLELKSKLAGADAASVDVAYLSNVIRSRAVEQVPV